MSNPIKVFGHYNPDTDTIVSSIAYAWYLNEVMKTPAIAYRLGDLNPETKFVLDSFGLEQPELLVELSPDDRVVIVDTNNLDELPPSIQDVTILEIIDHHRLTGGIATHSPVAITMRPMASTASLLYTLFNPEINTIPHDIAGILLAGLISDTLMYKSPTTTQQDREIGDALQIVSGIDAQAFAQDMFHAKSDIGDIPFQELVTMDSKVFDIDGTKFRIGVWETTSPQSLVDRIADIEQALADVLRNDDEIQDIMFFVTDIIQEGSYPIAITEQGVRLVEQAFGVVYTPGIFLQGIVSRKLQIVPSLLNVSQ